MNFFTYHLSWPYPPQTKSCENAYENTNCSKIMLKIKLPQNA
jgi:hypothetical protein